MTKLDSRQPAAISPDLLIRPQDYRASLHMELQKFGNREKARQLLLSEAIPPDETELESRIEQTGLNLSYSEMRAIDALQLLLDRTGYQGNEPGEPVHSEAFKYDGQLPRLRLTYTEYLEAYGLQRAASGRWPRAQEEEAKEALETLTEPRTVAYKRTYRNGKQTRSDVVIAKRPLINISKGYKGVTDEEAEDIIATEGRSRRPTHLLIEFSPLWIDQIKSFYVLKPVGFYNELREAMGSRRPSPAIPLFMNLLMTINMNPFKIGRDKLAERIKLDYLLDSRHQSRLDDLLQEAIDVALKMGYLLDYDLDTFKVYTFYLNPERCKRLKPGAMLETEEEN